MTSAADLSTMKSFEIQLTDIWRSSQREMISMKETINGLADCLKTYESIITELSQVNEMFAEELPHNVQQMPEFQQLIDRKKLSDESIRRQKEVLRIKHLLIDTNGGHNVHELIHSWNQVVTTKGKCEPTVDEIDDFFVAFGEITSEEMSTNVAINANNAEPVVITESGDRETFVAEESDVLADKPMAGTLDLTVIDVNHNSNHSESEAMAETTAVTDPQSDDNIDGKRRKRGRPAKKKSTTNGVTNGRQRGRPKLDSIGQQSVDALHHSSVGPINSSPTHIDGNNDCESEVSAKTDTDLSISGGSRLKRKTRITSAVKSLTTNGKRKARRSGGPTLPSTTGLSADRLYACDWPECGFTTKYDNNLVRHSMVHNNVKPYACGRRGCRYRTTYQSLLRSHRLKHNKNNSSTNKPVPKLSLSAKAGPLYTVDQKASKPYACQWPDCTFATIYKTAILGHTNAHRNYGQYACDEPDCKFRANYPSHMDTHRRRHNDPNYRYKRYRFGTVSAK